MKYLQTSFEQRHFMMPEHNATQNNDTQHEGLICDTQHK